MTPLPAESAKRFGRRVAAWVVLRPDAPASHAGLEAFCRARIAGCKVPARSTSCPCFLAVHLASCCAASSRRGLLELARRRLRETEAWAIALTVPLAVFAAIACYSAAAGCYALFMNCFSVVEPDTALTRTMFFAAKLAPFAFPTAALFALAGYVALYRAGSAPLRRWLWLAPALFVVALHAACALFAWTALPQRRLHPDLRFDAIALAFAYGYAALVHAALRALARWSEAHASRRWASSRS